jgi:hypothetical protein
MQLAQCSLQLLKAVLIRGKKMLLYLTILVLEASLVLGGFCGLQMHLKLLPGQAAVRISQIPQYHYQQPFKWPSAHFAAV